MNLKTELQAKETRTQSSPVDGFEYARGWGIYAHPFDSGHVLALRIFPENDFAPYEAIWHRTPEGEWTIFVDGPRLDTACPRYYGAAAEDERFTSITLDWPGPTDLSVEMDEPELVWTVSMADSALFDVLNVINSKVPEVLARTRPMTQVLEWVGDNVFDLGSIDLAGTAPNGQDAILLPRQLVPITSSSARLNGTDLGEPAKHPDNPTIGDLNLPARPVLAIGTGYFSIEDTVEYDRTIEELRDYPADGV